MTGRDPVDAFEREKWEAEKNFREKEIANAEREVNLKARELEINISEAGKSAWKNPLVIAIFAATVAAAGNAIVAVVNGYQTRQLEDKKSEQTRILEMIKTGDPDKAADNLQFLLDTGLIKDPEIFESLSLFIENRNPGTGPVLAASGDYMGGIVGLDDRRHVRDTTIQPYSSVCRIHRLSTDKGQWLASGTLIESRIIVSATIPENIEVLDTKIAYGASGANLPYQEEVPIKSIYRKLEGTVYNLTFFLLREESKFPESSFKVTDIGKLLAPVDTATIAGFPGDFAGTMATANGSILGTDETMIYHNIDTGAGTSGGPLFIKLRGDFLLLGIHFGTGPRKRAVRLNRDLIASAVNELIGN